MTTKLYIMGNSAPAPTVGPDVIVGGPLSAAQFDQMHANLRAGIDKLVGEAANATEESALFAAGYRFVVRTDLIAGYVPPVTNPAPSGLSITAFTVNSTPGSMTVPITSFVAPGATHYLITESATAPPTTATGWSTTAPTTYKAANASGAATLYAWVKDGTGVSAAVSRSVTLPTVTILLSEPGTSLTGWTMFNSPAVDTSIHGTSGASQDHICHTVPSFAVASANRLLQFDALIPMLGPGSSAGVDFSSFYFGFDALGSVDTNSYANWFQLGYSNANSEAATTGGFESFNNMVWSSVLRYTGCVASRTYNCVIDCPGDGTLLFKVKDPVTGLAFSYSMSAAPTIQSIQGHFNGNATVSPKLTNIIFGSY